MQGILSWWGNFSKAFHDWFFLFVNTKEKSSKQAEGNNKLDKSNSGACQHAVLPETSLQTTPGIKSAQNEEKDWKVYYRDLLFGLFWCSAGKGKSIHRDLLSECLRGLLTKPRMKKVSIKHLWLCLCHCWYSQIIYLSDARRGQNQCGQSNQHQ